MAKLMKIKITFKEELLGSSPSDPEIYQNFIGAKAEDPVKSNEEAESIKTRNLQISDEEDGDDDTEQQGITVFGRLENGIPFIWDYQIKGFFKNAAKAFYQVGGESKLTSYKTKIDNLVFIDERKIPLVLPEGKAVTFCQRPLRAQTAKGERIALACSEAVPEGTTAEFTIRVLKDALMKNVIEWLDYGALNGLGQWHNSGKGRFEWEDISGDEERSFNDKEKEKRIR